METAGVVDGTKKGCTGVIASLQRMLEDIQKGFTVEVLVPDVLTRREVYDWAARKGLSVAEEKRDTIYRLTVRRLEP